MVYSLEDLKKAYNKGQHYKFLFFWGHTPDSSGCITETCLSQWWMACFEIDGITYSCAEQFMMAEKARMFHDQEMLSLILEAKQPKAMKAYGRSVRNFDKGTMHAMALSNKPAWQSFPRIRNCGNSCVPLRTGYWWRQAQGTASGELVWERVIRMCNAR